MTLRVLSLGWGVQSWTLAAMAALGEIAPLDLAVPADTLHEHEGTYRFAAKWTPWLIERGVQVDSVKAGDGAPPVDRWGAVAIPAYSLTPRGRKGQIRKRQCTSNWKIKPIRSRVRALMLSRGLKPRPATVEQVIGFSLDEWGRMRVSDVRYIVNAYPLVDRRMTRADCGRWLLDHGLPIPPKSSCTFCPYQTARSWRELKRAGGADWDEAVRVDEEIRDKRRKVGHHLFVHPSCLPLAEAVTIPEDYGLSQPDLFDDDTEGNCASGVCFV